MQLVEDKSGEVVPFRGVGVGREDAEDGARLGIFDHVAEDAKLRREDGVKFNHTRALAKDDSGLGSIRRDDPYVRSDFGKERIERDPRSEQGLPILSREEEKTATLAASTVFFNLEEFVEDLLLPRAKCN
jgi:hypothetical protein